MAYVANKRFNEAAYVIFTGSALYAYVSHYFYIILVAVLLIRPFKLNFAQALILELILVNGFILVTYALFISIWMVAFPPEEKIEEESNQDDERRNDNDRDRKDPPKPKKRPPPPPPPRKDPPKEEEEKPLMEEGEGMDE